MDSFHLPTFLSDSVKHMVVDVGKNYLEEKSSVSQKFLTSSCTLDWESVNAALCFREELNIQKQSPDWFIDVIKMMWPIYYEAHSFVMNTCFLPKEIHCFLDWTSQPKEVNSYFNSFVTSNVSTLEAILFLTTIIERSLGNLYLLKGKTVPSLLRDLLATKEIKSLLGETPVVFLQILVGTPLALNLRNLAWHGFPAPDELHDNFASILFVVVLSVGEILIQKNICYNVIPNRPLTQYSPSLFCHSFPNIKKDPQRILYLLFLYNVIPLTHQVFWKQAMELFVHKKYGRSLILLLPQFEHMLRCLFCRVNNCSRRCLTAESVTLYTTMNEIMALFYIDHNGKEEKNRLIEFLGEVIMEMLQDIFVHIEGPRIRDKMSHGECNSSDINEMLVSHIFSVAVVVVSKCQHLESDTLTGVNIKLLDEDILQSFQKYELLFHPISCVKTNIKICLTGLDSWLEFLVENRALHNTSDKCNELSSELSNMRCTLLKKFTNTESVSNYILHKHILTVFRPKIEIEIINILKQVTENIRQVVQQVKHNLELKVQQHNLHLLRSRNRDTFKRMLNVVPDLKEMLFCILCFVILIMESINTLNELPASNVEKLQKFCRVILQFVQNVLSWTKCDKNRWIEIRENTMKLCCYVSSNQVDFIF